MSGPPHPLPPSATVARDGASSGARRPGVTPATIHGGRPGAHDPRLGALAAPSRLHPSGRDAAGPLPACPKVRPAATASLRRVPCSLTTGDDGVQGGCNLRGCSLRPGLRYRRLPAVAPLLPGARPRRGVGGRHCLRGGRPRAEAGGPGAVHEARGIPGPALGRLPPARVRRGGLVQGVERARRWLAGRASPAPLRQGKTLHIRA